LGGSLAVESRPGEGTSIRVRVPLQVGTRREGNDRWATR
jgi:signal transduction histidine kinase